MPITREVSVVFLQNAVIGAAKAQGMPNPLPISCPAVCDGIWGGETQRVVEGVLRQVNNVSISRARIGDRRVVLAFENEAAQTSFMNVMSGWARSAEASAGSQTPPSRPRASSESAPSTPGTDLVSEGSAGLRMPDWGWAVVGGVVLLGTVFAVRLASRGK